MNENSAILLWGLIAFLLYAFISRKIVKERSERLKALNALNETYQYRFHNYLQERKSIDYTLNSKAQYDRSNLFELWQVYVDENLTPLERYLHELYRNQTSYIEYEKAIAEIEASIPAHFFKRREARFLKKVKLHPPIDCLITLNARYTSPAGRNSYHKNQVFTQSDLEKEIAKVKKLREKRNSRKHQIKKERSLMTQSLRFKILERDQFTCQLCGSTVQDGVKLHIDHIKPVSKGGKTEEDNLMVLCDRCNLGKSDRVVEYSKISSE